MTDPDLNHQIEYTMWSVFENYPRGWRGSRDVAAEEIDRLQDRLSAENVKIRGFYRLSGMRARADWMVWWHAPSVSTLQTAYDDLRKTAWGAASLPVWSSVGLHRPAEFSQTHIPAYMRGEKPGRFLTVYPFVRSYEWYLLPADERRGLLARHGAAAKDYPDVISNTVASFGLGDYEWILALEAEQLHRLVDVMREFRGTDARLHVRNEIPFFAGERMAANTLIRELP